MIWHKGAQPPGTDHSTVFARWRQYAPPSNTWFIWSPWVHIQNGISISGAVFAGLTCSWPTETQTQRSRYTCSNSQHLMLAPYALRCGLIIDVHGRRNRSGRPGGCWTNNLTNKNFYVHIMYQSSWTWNEIKQVEKCVHCGQLILRKIS